MKFPVFGNIQKRRGYFPLVSLETNQTKERKGMNFQNERAANNLFFSLLLHQLNLDSIVSLFSALFSVFWVDHREKYTNSTEMKGKRLRLTGYTKKCQLHLVVQSSVQFHAILAWTILLDTFCYARLVMREATTTESKQLTGRCSCDTRAKTFKIKLFHDDSSGNWDWTK